MELTGYQRSIVLLYIVIVAAYALFGGGASFAYTDAAIAPLPLAVFTISIVGLFMLLAFWRGLVPARPRSVVRVVAYAVLIAFAEELLFRGVIQGALQSVWPAVLSVALASIIFGLAHLPHGASGWQPFRWNWGFALLAGLGGIPLGALFVLTGSLFMPVLLHMVFVVSIELWKPSV